MLPRACDVRLLPCGENIALDVLPEGPSWRLLARGCWDVGSALSADDYSRDAPEAIPAGSCVWRGEFLGVDQRTVTRE